MTDKDLARAYAAARKAELERELEIDRYHDRIAELNSAWSDADAAGDTARAQELLEELRAMDRKINRLERGE